jgi:hypothetical protein
MADDKIENPRLGFGWLKAWKGNPVFRFGFSGAFIKAVIVHSRCDRIFVDMQADNHTTVLNAQ